MSKIFCRQPFFYIEINCFGDVRMCCEHWCNFYTLGNILENSFDEILNGDKYKAFIKQFEEQKFEFCNLDICPLKVSCTNEEYDRYYRETISSNKILRINFDVGCNLRCIFCRNNYIKGDARRVKRLNDKIREILPLMNKEGWIISIDGSGEIFTSKNHLELIRDIVLNYPNINFSIMTNGILASKEMFQELGIENRIENIEVSVHAFTKKTYEKIVIGSNFTQLKKNLEYIGYLKKTGKLKSFYMDFVFNSENFHEMEKFAKWALSLNAVPSYLPLVKYGQISQQTFKKLNIADESHPRYNSFVRMLKKPIFSSDKVSIPQGYLDLKEKKEKNIFKRIFKL